MSNLNFIFENSKTEVILNGIKLIMMTMFIYCTNFKIINRKLEVNIFRFLEIILIAIISLIFKLKVSFETEIICLLFMISMLFSRYKVNNTVTVTIMSFVINYSILIAASILNFVLNKIILINNDYINLLTITLFQIILLYKVMNIKKLKNGVYFIKDDTKNDYMDVLVLNICIISIFSIILLSFDSIEINMKIFPILIIGIIALVITVGKIIQLYYKQKLLINDLNETKDELAAKNKEIEKLEQENLNFSKISHSLAHKQKSLEHKIDELLLNSEIAGEIDVRDRLEEISKKLYKTPIVKLDKTGITQVDDMLNVMQSECIKNNIEFNLQIIGNVYHIINNIVTVDELEILIADHVKDAIIAINHTDNVNRSILIRLGKIDDCYGLYIHDSGIEFEKETLEKLGKEPITTHKSEGGTGMGFMNTFDTLKKCKGSLIINEIGKPSKDNFTKIVMIRFDGKNEFRVVSYRENNDEI